MGVTAGIVGAVGAVGQAGSGILGGILNRGAAGKAASAEQQYLNKALQFQEGVYNTAGTNLQPWITGGQEALGGEEAFLGLASSGGATGTGGSGALSSFNQFTQTPYYTFPQAQFTSQAERAAGQLGITQSAGDIANIGKMAGNYASGNFMNYIQALNNLSGMGLQGSQILGQIGTNVGQQVGNTELQQASVAGSGILGQQAGTNQIMSGIGNLFGALTGSGSGYGGGSGGGNTGSQGLIQALSPLFAANNYGSAAPGTPGISASGNPVMSGFAPPRTATPLAGGGYSWS